MSAQDEDLARRVYSYFIFRLRQPEDAERLTRLSFERFWREESLSREAEQEPDLPVFAAARVVIAENPRPRGAVRVELTRGDDGDGAKLHNELVMAMGRLHGRERDALALRFGAELSVGEIAEVLDRTPAEVKQRLARGVRTLIDLGVLPEEEEPTKSPSKRTGTGRSKQRDPEQRKPGE